MFWKLLGIILFALLWHRIGECHVHDAWSVHVGNPDRNFVLSGYSSVSQESEALKNIDLYLDQCEEKCPVFVLDSNQSDINRKKENGFDTLLEQIQRSHPNADIQRIQLDEDSLRIVSSRSPTLVHFFSKLPQNFLREASMQPPIQYEVAWGVVNTALQTGIRSFAWFASASIHPALAFGLTALFGAVTATTEVYSTAWSQVFHKSSYRGNETFVDSAVYKWRRRIFSYAFYGLLAVVSSGGDPTIALSNFAQSIPTSLVAVEGRLSVSNYVQNYLRVPQKNGDGSYSISDYNRVLATRFYNLISAVIVPLALMDMSGMGATIVTLGFYSLKTTTVATFAAYLALWFGVKKSPDSLKFLLKLPEFRSERRKPFHWQRKELQILPRNVMVQ